MIGNDIVDLVQADIDSNWRRKGYLDKVFTKKEQAMIMESLNPSQMVWLLWSMKEAAYKIHSRLTGWNALAPLRIQCIELHLKDTRATGTVICKQVQYFTQSCVSKDFIHTIASQNFPIEQIRIDISAYNPDDRSYRNTLPTTVSHHGRYLALAYL